MRVSLSPIVGPCREVPGCSPIWRNGPRSAVASWSTARAEAEIVLDGQPTKVVVFVVSLPFSDAFDVCAFPRECTEAFLKSQRPAQPRDRG